MPNQIEGKTDDGRVFYFRARHQWACLYIGNSWEVVSTCAEEGPDKSIVWGKWIPRAGWFEPEEFEALFWQVIKELEQ